MTTTAVAATGLGGQTNEQRKDKDLIPVEEAVSILPEASLALPALKKKSGKKGKKFADKALMLKLVEEIGDRENERIQLKTQKDVEKLKIIVAREAIAAKKKESKKERLERIKESLKRKNEQSDELKPSKDDNKGGKKHQKSKVEKSSDKDSKKKPFKKTGKKVSFKE